MYKVYLVDDEHFILDELKLLIDWEKYGFRICGSNTNPEIALKEIETENPNLVISDIFMAPLDGFSLQKALAAINPHIYFCFLTAYDSFDYAHAAIKLGVCDYLLKPVDISDLIATLNKVKKRLLYDAGMAFRELNYCTGEELEEKLKNFFQNVCPIQEQEKSVLSVSGAGAEKLSVSICAKDCFCVYSDENKSVFVVSDLDEALLKTECEKIEDVRCGVSEKFEDIYEFPKAISQASSAMDICQQTNVAYYRYEETDEGTDANSVSDVLIQNILDDISLRISEKLRLEEYANKYGYSVSRLSHRFKDRTGNSFREYVLCLKIEKAKEYLKTQSYSVTQVAYMVGYDDYYCFSKIFKKYVGCSPRFYKENNCR